MRWLWSAAAAMALTLALVSSDAASYPPPPPEEDYPGADNPRDEDPRDEDPGPRPRDEPDGREHPGVTGDTLRSRAEEEAGKGVETGTRPWPRTPVRRPDRDLTGQIRELGETRVSTTDGRITEDDGEAIDTGLGPCRVRPAGGWFQPVQGVFQDDDTFPFITYEQFGNQPRPNPQLERLPTGGLSAWLPMIHGRPTVLMGAVRIRKVDGSIERPNSLGEIVIKGVGDCNKPVDVRVRFMLTDADGTRPIWTSQDVWKLPLEGYARPRDEPFEVRLPSGLGLPADTTFTIAGSHGSAYSILAQLIRADTGAPTGIQLFLGGTVEKLTPPRVRFVPLHLGGREMSAAEKAQFERLARELAARSGMAIPDYFPLPPRSLPTFATRVLDMGRYDPRLYKVPGLSDPSEHPRDSQAQRDAIRWRQEVFSARISNALGASGLMSGVDRIVALLGGQGSYRDILLLRFEAAGFIESTKVSFVDTVNSGGTGYRAPIDLVQVTAHELAHSLPEMLWSGRDDANHNMLKSCGINFHNRATGPVPPAVPGAASGGAAAATRGWASGLKLTEQGLVTRNRVGFRHHSAIMGPARGRDTWITQCTYAHLIRAMREKPDPELFLVRAIVSRAGGQPRAWFESGYELLGVADLEPGEQGVWAIRVVDAGGRVLGRYPFEPHWETEEDLVRDHVSVLHRVPAFENAAAIEIVHRDRVLATNRVSAHPPRLTVSPPQVDRDAETVHLRWSAEGEGPLLSSVFVSSDGGSTYEQVIFEERLMETEAPMDAEAGSILIKVVVTDGGRSTERIVPVKAPVR